MVSIYLRVLLWGCEVVKDESGMGRRGKGRRMYVKTWALSVASQRTQLVKCAKELTLRR